MTIHVVAKVSVCNEHKNPSIHAHGWLIR